jgi:hypothetical protein
MEKLSGGRRATRCRLEEDNHTRVYPLARIAENRDHKFFAHLHATSESEMPTSCVSDIRGVGGGGGSGGERRRRRWINVGSSGGDWEKRDV